MANDAGRVQSKAIRKRMRRATWDTWRKLTGNFWYLNGSLGLNPNGAQCVNVPNELYERVGLPAVSGDASEWVGFKDSYRRYFDTSEGIHLRSGDVPVFNPVAVGMSGHVDVVLERQGRQYMGLDQNWPPGEPVRVNEHGAELLLGFIRVVWLP